MSTIKKDGLGDRMKSFYEDASRFYLTRRTPVIMRLDGKAFHTLTKDCEKPFDNRLSLSMEETAEELMKEIQGAKFAYSQSDEISILITDFETIETGAWFDYNIQKMCSVSASIASNAFNSQGILQRGGTEKLAEFDCRVFNIPKEEVVNYFRWRYKDWLRNSIQMLAQSHFSQKELHGKKREDLHEMLHNIGVNWADLSNKWKNGIVLSKDSVSYLFNPMEEAWVKKIEEYLFIA